MSLCPICNNSASISEMIGRTIINCDLCGKYIIEFGPYSAIVEQLNDNDKLKSSMLFHILNIHKQNLTPIFYGKEWFNHDTSVNKISGNTLENTYPKNLIDRIDKCLINLCNFKPGLGEAFYATQYPKEFYKSLLFIDNFNVHDVMEEIEGVFQILCETRYLINIGTNGNAYKISIHCLKLKGASL